jgi:dihydroorotate dehydrogenase electron transfer subunit
LNVLGPLGRGFSVGEAQIIYLAGGGCGIAPLRFIPDQWPDRRYHAFLGYRSQAHVHLEDQFHRLSEAVHIATNDGSYGMGGFVTDLLIGGIENLRPDMLLACGPDPMLRKIQEIAQTYQIPCQMSLEERMGCGVGGCLVCACAVSKDGELDYKRVCADGPVFDSREVVF